MRIRDVLTPECPEGFDISRLPSSCQTPMILHFISVKARYPDSILFYRMGDFYEMFFEDAEEASRVLDLTLTSRNKNDENPIAMCGIPHHAAAGYIQKLCEKGYRVAICDQVEDPKLAKGMVKREVTRVVTPAMVLDPMEATASKELQIVGLFRSKKTWNVCIFSVTSCRTEVREIGDLSEHIDLIEKLRPQEILVWDDDAEEILKSLQSCGSAPLAQRVFRVKKTSGSRERLLGRLSDLFGGLVLDAFGLDILSDSALTGLLSVLLYVNDHQRVSHWSSFHLVDRSRQGELKVDAMTYEHLEVFETMDSRGSQESAHSLVSVFQELKTGPGKRHVVDRLLHPMTSPEEIHAGHQSIVWFLQRPDETNRLGTLLEQLWDLERLGAKAATRSLSPPNFVQIEKSLNTSEDISRVMGAECPIEILERVVNLRVLAHRIRETLVDAPPLDVTRGQVIRKGFDSELDRMRLIYENTEEWMKTYESEERERSQIGSLKIKFNRVHGFSIEISKANVGKVPPHYERKQTLVAGERYVTPELRKYEQEWLRASEFIETRERVILEQLSAWVQPFSKDLISLSHALARVDLSRCAALLVRDGHYCLPTMTEDRVIDLVDSRHPVLERIQGQEFVPNSVRLDDKTFFVMLTGPNMSGKSTFMRQLGLTVLLAQAGLPVPATRACMGIFKHLLSRVGASDRLSRGQSTFMVEMVETASILRRADEKSLVLIDEIGRGTSTNDGMSIAWAVAEYLIQQLRSMTLFATHYHELTALEDLHEGVRCAEMSIREWQGQVHFLRHFQWGACGRSYGINVAKLAGLPVSVVKAAEEKLEEFERIRPSSQMRLI